MKDKTAVMCHNIAKYDREYQTNEMNHAEVAEKLHQMSLDYGITANDLQILCQALTDEHRIASGKLVLVVHAHWIFTTNDWLLCSHCCKGSESLSGIKSNYNTPYCPNCGALMDGKARTGDSLNGKDDNHETD